jgi:type II secretory pathway component PulM
MEFLLPILVVDFLKDKEDALSAHPTPATWPPNFMDVIIKDQEEQHIHRVTSLDKEEEQHQLLVEFKAQVSLDAWLNKLKDTKLQVTSRRHSLSR